MDRPADRSETYQRGRQKLAYMPDDPLLTAAEAAAERGQGVSTFWNDVRLGRAPPGYYVSPRCRRWFRSELRADVKTRPAKAGAAV
jgi:hypothetical protein